MLKLGSIALLGCLATVSGVVYDRVTPVYRYYGIPKFIEHRGNSSVKVVTVYEANGVDNVVTFYKNKHLTTTFAGVRCLTLDRNGYYAVVAAHGNATMPNTLLYRAELTESGPNEFEILGETEPIATEGLIAFYEQVSNVLYYGTRVEFKLRVNESVRIVRGMTPWVWKYLVDSKGNVYFSHNYTRQLVKLSAKEIPMFNPTVLRINHMYNVNDMVIVKDVIYVATNQGMYRLFGNLTFERFVSNYKPERLIVTYNMADAIFLIGNKAYHFSFNERVPYEITGFYDQNEFKNGEYFLGMTQNVHKQIYFATNESAVYILEYIGGKLRKDPEFINNQEIFQMHYDPKYGVILLGDDIFIYETGLAFYNGTARGAKVMTISDGRVLIATRQGVCTLS